MKVPHLIAFASVLALATTGVVPAPVFVSEVHASKHKPGGTKARPSRSKSKKAADGKVSQRKKRGNANKKNNRKANGQSAKQGVSRSAAAAGAGNAPRRGILKDGKLARASMTAVNGAAFTPLSSGTTRSSPATNSPSLAVTTQARSPRSKKVTRRTAEKRAKNGNKKSTRRNRNRTAKTAVNAQATPAGPKVTFSGLDQVKTFHSDQPANRVGVNYQPPARPSTVSEVLPRLQMGQRSSSAFRRIVGRVARAFSSSKEPS